MKLLLDVPNIDLNVRDERGKTPLYKAVELGDLEAVQLLVKAGANFNIKALDGRNLFECALQELGDNYLNLIKYLYHEGGMIEKRKENARMTYLHMACLCKRKVKVTETIKELIRCGEFVNATEGSRKTPLILAVQMNRPELVLLLLENAADPRHVDLDAKSALQYAKPNTTCYKFIRAALAGIAKISKRAAKAKRKNAEIDKPEDQLSGKPKNF